MDRLSRLMAAAQGMGGGGGAPQQVSRVAWAGMPKTRKSWWS